MSNEGYVRNFRLALSPKTDGSQALTTQWEKVLPAAHHGDTRWVVGGSRVFNYTNADDGGGPCDYDLAYVPADSDSTDITDAMLIGGTEVACRDYHQLGEIPMCPGYEIWGKADANEYLNILLCFEEIE